MLMFGSHTADERKLFILFRVRAMCVKNRLINILHAIKKARDERPTQQRYFL